MELGDRWALEQSLPPLKPAVLLLDLTSSHFVGDEGLEDLRQLSPSTKIVAFTENRDEKRNVSLLRSGAKGYCNLKISPGLLRKAVVLVNQGEFWVHRKAISCVLDELNGAQQPQAKHRAPSNRAPRLSALTRREQEIVLLIANGSSNKEIATHLQVSEKTVKAHLTSIFRKLGTRDRLRLAILVNGSS